MTCILYIRAIHNSFYLHASFIFLFVCRIIISLISVILTNNSVIWHLNHLKLHPFLTNLRMSYPNHRYTFFLRSIPIYFPGPIFLLSLVLLFYSLLILLLLLLRANFSIAREKVKHKNFHRR